MKPLVPPPARQEIDHRTIKLIVGVVALSLATLTRIFAKSAITSISAAYYEGGWSQSIFIGFLFAIAAFLLAYNGMSRTEMILSKVAAGAGLGVALFPCDCDGHTVPIPILHGLFAAAMFFILAYFCYEFRQRACGKGHRQARARAGVYAGCGVAIVLSIVVLGLDYFSGRALSTRFPTLIFYGEAVGLIAFGISWLTASKVLPGLTRPDERFSPFSPVYPAA